MPEEELIPETRPEARPDPTTTFTPDPDSDNDEEELLFGEPVQQEVDQDTRFAASLAGLFGAEGVSETGEALTGLEIREPTTDEDPLDGL